MIQDARQRAVFTTSRSRQRRVEGMQLARGVDELGRWGFDLDRGQRLALGKSGDRAAALRRCERGRSIGVARLLGCFLLEQCFTDHRLGGGGGDRELRRGRPRAEDTQRLEPRQEIAERCERERDGRRLNRS